MNESQVVFRLCAENEVLNYKSSSEDPIISYTTMPSLDYFHIPSSITIFGIARGSVAIR